MNVFYSPQEFTKLSKAVVTSGTFDGVHLGHQQILNRVKAVSEAVGGESVLITFHPHPRMVLSGAKHLQLLSTIEEKIELLERNGIDNLLIIPFTREFSEWSSDDFIQKILIETIGTSHLVIGYDHRFGRDREGGFDFLKDNAHRYGFQIEEIPRHEIEQMTVSSSKIRAALAEGNVKLAAEYLGHPYQLSGTVVKGRQLGRTIGFPTANIQLQDAYKLVPVNGVYAVEVQYNSTVFGGVMNVGTRPTVDGTFRTIEVNIFDFDKEIYGETLTISYLAKIRNEQKFSGLEELKGQIQQDKEAAMREILMRSDK